MSTVAVVIHIEAKNNDVNAALLVGFVCPMFSSKRSVTAVTILLSGH